MESNELQLAGNSIIPVISETDFKWGPALIDPGPKSYFYGACRTCTLGCATGYGTGCGAGYGTGCRTGYGTVYATGYATGYGTAYATGYGTAYGTGYGTAYPGFWI